MTTATLTTKGQITIPAPVRIELNVGPGDRVEFVKISDNRFEIVAATKDITQIKGMISVDHSVSIDEMNAAIRAKANK
ncbi:MAG: AbrB/MazE/SpoVT family DNA-binding domain-containing protein [Gammaproteobacteria bacterium]